MSILWVWLPLADSAYQTGKIVGIVLLIAVLVIVAIKAVRK